MPVKPVISYPGAKFKAWYLIKPLIPRDIKDWREPFFGGGSTSLLIAEDPEFNLERMLVGDLAPEIWAFWQGCKEAGHDVVETAKKMFTDKCPTQLDVQEMDKSDPQYQKYYDEAVEEGREFWKWAQEVDCTELSLVERAARTLLVNRISFSGMGDAGSMSKDQFMDFRFHLLDRVIDAQPLLQKMEIKNCSFEETMADVDKDKTFIFLDPPYLNQEKSGLYGKGGETHHGFPHKHFANFTKSMECRWLITYDDSIRVRRMFRGCYLKPFVIPYTMAGGQSEDALAGEELFIANYDIRDKTDESLIDLL